METSFGIFVRKHSEALYHCRKVCTRGKRCRECVGNCVILEDVYEGLGEEIPNQSHRSYQAG